jgi:hypothetical protein
MSLKLPTPLPRKQPLKLSLHLFHRNMSPLNIDMLLQSSYVLVVHSSATLMLYDFSDYFDDSIILQLATLLVRQELQFWLSLCYEGMMC